MRFGIIGTGRIAERFIKELEHVKGASVSCVYNPHSGRAAEFVGSRQDAIVGTYGNAVGGLSRFELPEPTDDIERLWELTDAIYIASPHETHYVYTQQALEQGKHVLCEKPMGLTEENTEELFKLASQKKLILMEGLKTAYMPGFRQMLGVAKSGIIGDIVQVNATFTKLTPETGREFKGEAAGSFIELGSYGMLAIFSLLGTDYKAVHFDSFNNTQGVDTYTVAHFDFGNAFATATAGLGVKSEGSLVVAGTKGYITVPAPWWLTKHFEVHFEDPKKIIAYDDEMEGDGLRYEIRAFLDKTIIDSSVSIEMAKVMQEFRDRRKCTK